MRHAVLLLVFMTLSNFTLSNLAMAEDNGIVAKPSKYSVAETINRVESAARAKGIIVFARIDHGGEADKVGLSLRPTQLLILGNPKGGTPLMAAVPGIAIDLPMKVLAWQDADGKVWVGYNSPDYLKRRHGLTDEQAKPLGALGTLIDAALQ